MKGGINKIKRNFAARKGKNEFEKVQTGVKFDYCQRLIKGTYGGDEKEPKRKHVICKIVTKNNILQIFQNVLKMNILKTLKEKKHFQSSLKDFLEV